MTDFLIRVILDPGPAEKGAKRVRRELDKTDTSADKLNRTLSRALTVAGVTLAVRKLGQYADAYTNIQNRLRTVTDGQEELTAATRELFEIADRTRSSYEGTAEVYARVGLAAQSLGRDQSELLAFTESLNQAVILSGASGTEAKAGLIQLSQGLASGALRGDELRSVLEQLPVVADVIAKSLGVTRGELRTLGAEGKISAEIVLDAFKEARVELDERFGETVPTLGQSFEVLNNNILASVGALDEATGASAALSAVIIGTAENLDLAAGAVIVLAAGIAAAYVPATLTAGGATTFLIAKLRLLTATLAANPFALAVTALTAAGVAAKLYTDELARVEEQILKTEEAGSKFALSEFGKVGDDILRIQKQVEILQENIDRDVTTKGFANPTAVRLLEQYKAKLESLGLQQSLLADGTAATTVEAQQQIDALEALAGSVDEVIAKVEQENGLLRENAREREIQAQLLREIAALEKGDGPDLTETQKEEIEAALRRNQALRDQAEILDRLNGPQQEFEAQLVALNELLAAGTINEQQFNAELERLAQGLDAADFSNIDIDAFTAGLDPEKLAEFRQILEGLRGGGDGAPAVGGGLVDPQATEELTGLQGQFVAIQDELDGAFTDSLDGAGRALLDFSQGGAASFSEPKDSLLADIASILANQALNGLLGAFGGGDGGGGLFSSLGSLFGGARAGGGPVNPNQAFLTGEEGPELFTPPGFGQITPAGETAALLSGGQAAAPVVNVAPPSVTILNVSDPGEIPSGIESPDGERAIMNVVRRRRRELKSTIG